ncbi:MAG: DUF793 domain-containing protein [Actinobacteria bacterium]|nr:DUF793 domain-containing protein [Actinomycetota bacterium]
MSDAIFFCLFHLVSDYIERSVARLDVCTAVRNAQC